MDEDEGNPRSRELAANSEEELLAMQEEFMAQHRRPAANVTRVSRRNGSGAPSQPTSAPLAAPDASFHSPPMLPSSLSHAPGRVGGVGGVGAVHGPPEGSVRGDEDLLRITTEEELLRMQEEFIAQNSPPAAKVTRITRPAAPSATDPTDDTATVVLSTTVGAPASGSQSADQAASAGSMAAAKTAAAAESRAGGGVALAGGGARAGKPAAAVAAAGSQERKGPRSQRVAPEPPTSILPPIAGLLGDIVERPCPAAPPEPPLAGPVPVRDVVTAFPRDTTAAAAGHGSGASFPEALHRRQSKFALSRKTKQQQQLNLDVAPSPSTAYTALPPGTAGSTTTSISATSRPLTSRSLIDWSVLPTGPVSAEARAAAAAQDAALNNEDRPTGLGGGTGDAGELGAIGEHNLEAVTRMAPEEVAAALQELSSRMSPEALDFLRHRGAQRLAASSGTAVAQRPQPQPAGSPSMAPRGERPAAAPRPRPRLGLDAEMGSCEAQEDGNAVIDSALRTLTAAAAPGGAAAADAALPASVAAPGNPLGSLPIGALAAVHQRQQGGGGKSAPAASPKGGGDGGGAAAGGPTRGSPADPRLVARLRFDVDCAVVDVQGPQEVFEGEEVLLRDQLRRDEGSAPPGYTLGELLVLCRSAVAAQRVAGLAAIADLAATARPRPEDISLHAPPAAAAAGPAAAGGPLAASVNAEAAPAGWVPGQMLRRFVPIPAHLRERAPLGSVSWQEVWQFFVSELGLVAHLRLALDDDRPGVTAAAAIALASVLGRSESELLAAEMADLCPSTGWPAAAGGYLTRRGITALWEAAPSAPAAAAAAPDAEDEPDAPEDVALVDPLAGALQMGLLQRIRYLLESRHAPRAVLPLLAVLAAAARAGGEVALAVAREPGLLAAVGGLLDPAAAAAAAAAAAPGPEAAAAEPCLGPAVQVAALMVVRLLCSASSVAAHLVRTSGLLANVQAYVLLAGSAADGGGATAAGSAPAASQQEQEHQQAAAGPVVAVAGPLALQLLRLEALRTWRVCAHHGISLASLDDLYGNLCHLLLPPLLLQAGGGGEAAAGSAAAAAGCTVWQLTTAELYLLLATLVRHSFAVAGGDATIGRSMIGPGPAAVIAAEALVWLRPAVLGEVASAVVTRCNLVVPLLSGGSATAAASGGGPSGSLLRVLLGAHPAVLLPPAAAHTACLAAVAAFLGTYWATAAATQPVFANVRLALAASGLLLPLTPLPSPPNGSSSAVDVALAPMLPTDALALALLRVVNLPLVEEEARRDGGGGAAATTVGEPRVHHPQAGSPVGRALSGWALAAMGGALVAAAAAPAEGLRMGMLAQSCLQVGAASLLHGVLQLAAAVHRDDPAAAAAATGPLAAAVVTAAAPLCCQAAAAAPVTVGRVLCPWHAAALQHQLHLTRLLLLAATLLPPHCYTAAAAHDDVDNGDAGVGSSSYTGSCSCSVEVIGAAAGPPQGAVAGTRAGGSGGAQQRREEVEEEAVRRLQLSVLEGCLAALSASPPGAEGLCLQALRLALRDGLLAAPLRAAHAAVTKLAAAAGAGGGAAAGDGKLAAAAAGMPYSASSTTTAACPFPLPDTPAPAADVAEVLFESYAASWLSLISQRRLAAGASEGTSGVAAEAQPSPPLPRLDPLELTSVSLQGQCCSRLPAPCQWAMLEAHRLPRRPHQQGQQQQEPGAATGQSAGDEAVATAAGLHPVGSALLLSLGREEAGSGRDGGGGGGGGALQWLPDGAKAQAALQAAYLFRAEEMVPRDADAASEGSWRDPWVRWSLAGLSRRYLFSRDGCKARPPGAPGREWLPAALAEQLVAVLGSVCFGDPLLGAHLGLALAREASPVVRLQVWNGLAADKSLHLLPPLSRCLGAAQQYLGPNPPAAAAASPSVAGAAAAAADPRVEPVPDLALLAAVHRSLIEGDLDRALQPLAAAAAAAATAAAAGSEPGYGRGRTAPASVSASVAASAAAAHGCASVAGDVALQLLAGNLLKRERWPALERAWRRSGGAAAQPEAASASSDRGDSDDDGGGGGRRGASAAAAMLGALVRSARPELAATVVLAAERWCGLRLEAAAAVVAQTCAGGGAALQERVRHVLALCGLV